jgi:hypothetical protein
VQEPAAEILEPQDTQKARSDFAKLTNEPEMLDGYLVDRRPELNTFHADALAKFLDNVILGKARLNSVRLVQPTGSMSLPRLMMPRNAGKTNTEEMSAAQKALAEATTAFFMELGRIDSRLPELHRRLHLLMAGGKAQKHQVKELKKSAKRADNIANSRRWRN